MTTQLTECTFSTADGTEFSGFTCGQTWNGWDEVYVTATTLRAIREYFQTFILGDELADLFDGCTQDADGLTLLNGWATTVEA